MTEAELYDLYAGWTGQLHFWMDKELGRHLDVEFFPAPDWLIKLYSGHAEERLVGGWSNVTVPGLKRPSGEARAVIALPRPERQPTKTDLDNCFREICLMAARILEIDLGKPKLGAPPKPMLTNKRRKKKT